MDIYIYTEGIRKVKGEEQLFLAPLAELEDFETVDDALEALVDEMPDLLGTEFVIFTQQPDYVTVEPPPESKYSFTRRDGNRVVEEPEDEEPEVEEDEEPEAPRRRPAAAKKPAAKKKSGGARRRPAAKKKSGARAGTRVGASKRTPFTRNPASVE